ncbi:hypothetical protein [Xenorhabdus bovienii]|uniref:hypothetical protein n=1 Tax=Xenorhabdus bovienii TaxID=40576 RepID=UPI0023B348BC|nr:hypothetical protein [Xenorhabdus bovienii]MDE9430961.1 hypothetical protein [Xenorhabdus bovienii]MDE9440330.1 hypothetical protein [Xenorhabdus bovienii]MDE9488605.1 hypothetical protein [Xenorhabdus bovienii]MDE9504985.1 hypothetical protein [Xenorhabdus bovienii]MDE9546109.1 hypothetical protein [Xenorhabdus bovienii]
MDMDKGVLTNKERLDLLQKMIVRTDGFHNYANTKSTIILTFIAAIIAAICTNINKAISYLECSDIESIVIVFKCIAFISLTLLIWAMKIVIATVTPYIQKSKTKNIYSFIDINAYYNSELEFRDAISSEKESEIINSLALLQYNLSIGLIRKYEKHKLAIKSLSLSIFLIYIEMIIIFMA